VRLRDGRVLAYEEYGISTGFPVLSFHGGLSSRLDAAPAHEAAVAKGIRLISPDRPGMGLSTYQHGRRLTDWPADVAQLTDALGIERFAVMGWSAGGPYAAVCAAKMDGRVTAAAFDAPGPSQYFADRALAAAKLWLFAPAKMDGHNVPSEWVLRFEIDPAAINVYPAQTAP